LTNGEPERSRSDPRQGLSSTAPGRLQADDDNQEPDSSTLFKVTLGTRESSRAIAARESHWITFSLCMDIFCLTLRFLSHFEFLPSVAGVHSTTGAPLAEYLGNYDDTEHSGDSGEEDSNILSQVSLSHSMIFVCLLVLVLPAKRHVRSRSRVLPRDPKYDRSSHSRFDN
jgi:hypothetical protein